MNRGALIDKFFNNYPSDVVLENSPEMFERLEHMREAVSDLRIDAIMRHSIKDLQEAQAFEFELAKVLAVYHQKRRERDALQV